MSFALASFWKDITRWRQDVMSTMIWIFIPLMIGGLLTMLMSGQGVKPHGVLLMVDQDGSFLSELIAGAYSAGELGELISVEKTTLEEGTERINAGGASGLLIIPKGFGAAFLESEPVTLTLKTNPAQTILPGIITNVTEILLDAGFYAHELLADEIKTFKDMSDDPSDAVVAAMAVGMRHKFESVGTRLYPPAIEIEIVEPQAKEPGPPLALLFMPGIILMAVLFAVNSLAGDGWREREQGTLRRLVFAPGKLGEFVAGKALAAAAIVCSVGGVTLVAGFLYHDVSWLKLPVSLLWISASGVALFAWFSLLQMLFPTRKAANLFSSMLLFPLLMVGGSFFPFEAMPAWMAAIGRVSPNGFVAHHLKMEIISEGAWSIAPTEWLIVTSAAVVGLIICQWRLQSGFARS
jgi:ABC-type Na+ efflux pump permease subunit